MKYPEHLYLKSPQELADIGAQGGISRWREAMENTVRVAQMCNVELDFSRRYAPVYPVPREKLQIENSNSRQAAVDEALSTPTQADDELYLPGVALRDARRRAGDPGAP